VELDNKFTDNQERELMERWSRENQERIGVGEVLLIIVACALWVAFALWLARHLAS
jgi:hypothetical protein